MDHKLELPIDHVGDRTVAHTRVLYMYVPQALIDCGQLTMTTYDE